MIRSLKRLWKDRRGNAIVIAGAAMIPLAGAVGLATDTVQWVLYKRELQRAADSAAFAGVYAKAQSETVSSAVTADLAKGNNHTGVSLLSGYPSITYPADTSNYNNAVAVELRIQKALGFSSLFLSTPPTLEASATAAMIDTGSYCLWTKDKIIIGGSSTTTMGCPAISDSTDSPSVSTPGTAYTFTAPKVAAAGTLPSSINGVTTLAPHHFPLPDPFAGKYSTSIPAGCNEYSATSNQATYTTGTGQNKVTHIYSYETKNVCFSSFKFSGGTYVLDAGTYYIDSADFDTTGGTTLTSSTGGVTIILTGNTPGSIKMNGSATINLSAPSAGTYKNMLFIQSSSATLANQNTIQGDANSKFDGSIYMPNGLVELTGNSSASTKCLMIAAYQAKFSGNLNLQNDTTGCNNATQVPGKEIRLIA